MNPVKPIAWTGIGVGFIAGLALVAWVLWPASPAPAAEGDVTRTAEAGGITVTVTKTMHTAAEQTQFRLILDTHTVDLADYDLHQNIVLERADQSRISMADAPTITARTGHHVDAYIHFQNTETPFVVVLKDLGGIPERRLTFE